MRTQWARTRQSSSLRRNPFSPDTVRPAEPPVPVVEDTAAAELRHQLDLGNKEQWRVQQRLEEVRLHGRWRKLRVLVTNDPCDGDEGTGLYPKHCAGMQRDPC